MRIKPAVGTGVRKNQWTGTALLLILLSLTIGLNAADFLFDEEFDNYGNHITAANVESRVCEWPPSQKFLYFEPTKPGLLFKQSERVAKEAPGWRNFELRFRFKFRFGEKKPHFDLLLPTATDAKKNRKGMVAIGYGSPYRILFRGGKSFPFGNKNKLADPLVANSWYDAVVRVENGILEAFVDNGEMTRIGLVELPKNVRVRGFNVKTASKIYFDYFRVVELPEKMTPALVSKNGVETANRSTAVELKIPSNANTASAELKVGEFGQMGINLVWSDGKKTATSVKVNSAKHRKSTLVDGKWKREIVELPDASLQFRGAINLKKFSRPKLDHYADDGLRRVLKHWSGYPAASKTYFKFETRLDSKGVQFWLDGRYAGRFDTDKRLTAIEFALSPGGSVRDKFAGDIKRDKKFLVLDTAKFANPGVMKGAKSPLKAEKQLIDGVPFDIASPDESFDIGKVRENRGSWMLECDSYLSRTAFCGQKESFLVSVPKGQYINAYAICAVEDSPDKDPILTARLTQYWSSGQGPSIADTTVRFPRNGGKLPANMKRLGTMKITRENGKPGIATVYFVKIPIDVGKIQDIIFQKCGYSGVMMKQPYLDFEFLGKTDIADTQQWSRKYKPDASSTSGAHVLGATLEKSPVETVILPARKWSAYYPNQKPGADVTMRPLIPGNYTLSWDVSDVHGNPLSRGERKFHFSKTGGELKTHIDFPQKKFGWYGVLYRLTDAKGNLLLKHKASFVLQPENTRKAGYDSPYYTWWFGGAHGTPRTYEEMGEFFERSGIHRTNMLENYRARKNGLNNEAAAAKWKLTNPHIKRQRSRSPRYSDKYKQDLIAAIKESIKNFPHASSTALIFHESCRGTFPVELLGAPTPKRTKQQIETEKKTLKHALFMAKLYRENFPDVKLIVGNTGNSLPGIASLLRQKIPAKYIDYIGDESVGQTFSPEKNGLDGAAFAFWAQTELAKNFGYDLPVAACHEWKSRNVRSLGPIKTAAWPVRDAIIAYAWGSPLIPLRGPMEVSNAYWNSLWGDGMFTRNPELYPTPSFAATATLTQLLDQVKFAGQIPTGSLTTYALAFSRGKKNVYTLWTTRGEAKMEVKFNRDCDVTITDMYGAATKRETSGRKISIETGEEVVYLTADADAKIAEITTGARSFANDKVPAVAKVVVVDKMDDLSKWKCVNKTDPRIDNPLKHGNVWPFRKAGDYALTAAKDPEKGECLELTLKRKPKTPKLMRDYTLLELKKPIEVPGKPTTIGVWVRGNSSWARLMWEFIDAEGEKWLSCGTGGYGCDIYDWPGHASVNFDGWNFIQMPINDKSPYPLVRSPGAICDQWVRSEGGNGKIDYPIKLTGIAVSMTPNVLYIKKMKKTKPVLRFKDLSVY